MDNKNRAITIASAILVAAASLAACGKVDIQPKKERTEDDSSFVYDIDTFLNTSSAADSGTSSIDTLVVLPDDEDALTDLDSEPDRKTTTTKASTTTTTTTTKPVTTTIPTTTTPRPTTTTPRPTTTTPAPTTTTTTTTTPAPTTTTTTTTTTPAPTTTTTTTTSSQTQSPDLPPPIFDDDSSEDEIVIPTPDQPAQGELSTRSKASMNGTSAGVGDSYVSAQTAFGAEIYGSQSMVLADGRTQTEHYFSDITIREVNGAINYYEINTGSSASTAAGLRAGMTRTEMESLYGTNYQVFDSFMYTYTEGTLTMTVNILGDIVQKITVYDYSV